jgi:HemY protein
MIWSMVKITLFVLLIALAALVAGRLADMESFGTIRVAVANWEFTLGPLQAVIVALVLMLAVWLVLKALGLLWATYHFLRGDETAISRYFDRNREKRGYQALSDGFLALASGEGRLALIKAQRAERYLDKTDLTTLLVAQAAETAGDGKRATEAYKALLASPATRFVGVRGLMKRKLAEGDTEMALKLAQKAFEMKPRNAESQDILLQLQSEKADWKGARATLNAKQKSGALPKDVYRRRDAVMALQEAKTVVDEEASIEAREAAIEANKLSPDLIPAAAMAARFYIGKGDKRSAARVLKKAWEAQPHPDLAAVFAEIEPDETPQDRVRRFKLLTAVKPDHPETRQLLAELNLAAEDFPAARRALGDLATSHPTQRNLAIMAAVERGEGSDDQVVRAWLAKALTASRGPQWCCDSCQAIHADWMPNCSNCNGFDTLSWREPQTNGAPASAGADLLPLWIGSDRPAPQPTPAPRPAEEPFDIEAVVRSGN